jgi:hypothetical protein
MAPSSRLLSLVLFVFVCNPPDAAAQTVGPDEAIAPQGGITQMFAFAPAQRKAIYNLVIRQKAPAPTRAVSVFVGAPVLPWVSLGDLPSETAGAGFLKYVVVDNEVVIVDPIQMRVVDVIYGAAIH